MKKVIFSMLVMCIGTLFAFAKTEKCEKAGQKEYKSEEGCDYKTRTCCGTPGSKNLYWSGWNEECKPPKICMHYCEFSGGCQSYENSDWYAPPYNSGEYRCKYDLHMGPYNLINQEGLKILDAARSNPRRYSYTRPDGTCDESLLYTDEILGKAANYSGYLYPEEQQCDYYENGDMADYWCKHYGEVRCSVSLIDESMVGKVEVEKDVHKWECGLMPDGNDWFSKHVKREISGRSCGSTVIAGNRCDIEEGSSYTRFGNGDLPAIGNKSCLLGKEGSTYLCTCVYTGREKVLEDVPVIMLN